MAEQQVSSARQAVNRERPVAGEHGPIEYYFPAQGFRIDPREAGGSDPFQGRILHTMVRVKDLDRALDFYVRILGMRLLRKEVYEASRFTIAMVGFGPEGRQPVIELTDNWDEKDGLQQSRGFGHFGIGVRDVYACCERLAAEGVPVVRPPGPVRMGEKIGKIPIAFIEDPDGNMIELLHWKPLPPPPIYFLKRALRFVRKRLLR